ncbi:MAG: hypothetical protein D3910_22160, partial [Candidatus Electrothrix sp. ATG2]|nr:hypothetical protein [Candidatus Electrothrix sp. ATG2]
KKGKNRFGAVPEREESSSNLEAPETAPAEPVKRKSRGKTERTEPMNFRVTAQFKKEFKKAALEHDLKLVEFLETCFESYLSRK